MTFTSQNNQQEITLPYQRTVKAPFTAEELQWIIRLQNEQRQSIANQLRDSIGQVLTCCKLLVETKQPDNEQKVLEMVSKHLQQSINDIMHLSYKMTESFHLEERPFQNSFMGG